MTKTKHPSTRAERLRTAHKHRLTNEEKKLRAEIRKANKVRRTLTEEYKSRETFHELNQARSQYFGSQY